MAELADAKGCGRADVRGYGLRVDDLLTLIEAQRRDRATLDELAAELAHARNARQVLEITGERDRLTRQLAARALTISARLEAAEIDPAALAALLGT